AVTTSKRAGLARQQLRGRILDENHPTPPANYHAAGYMVPRRRRRIARHSDDLNDRRRQFVGRAAPLAQPAPRSVQSERLREIGERAHSKTGGQLRSRIVKPLAPWLASGSEI